MVMRLDFESARPAVANVDDSRIFAGPLQNEFAARGQPFQMDPRRFVRAMLAPHHAEDAQFGERGLPASEKLLDLLVLVRRQAVLAEHFGRKSGSQRGSHGKSLYCRISDAAWGRGAGMRSNVPLDFQIDASTR